MKKKDIAVAVKYDPAVSDAPKVMASGQGTIARKIMDIAEENGIPIQESPELAATLAAVPHGENIPVETFGIVADIITFLMKSDQKLAKKINNQKS